MPKYITTQVRTYNNRRLKAGDEMPGLSRRDGDLMVKLGRAKLVPDALAQSGSAFKVPPLPKPPKPAAAAAVPAVTTEDTVPVPADDADQTPPADDNQTPTDETPVEDVDTFQAARDEYERVVGKKWFHGWDEAELRKRIAEHQNS